MCDLFFKQTIQSLWLPEFDLITKTLQNECDHLFKPLQPITDLQFCDVRAVTIDNQSRFLTDIGSFFQLHADLALTPEILNQYARRFTQPADAQIFIIKDLLKFCAAMPPVDAIDLMDRLFLKRKKGAPPLLSSQRLIAVFRNSLSLPNNGFISLKQLCDALGFSDLSDAIVEHRGYKKRLARPRLGGLTDDPI